jgi:hypothetical protein
VGRENGHLVHRRPGLAVGSALQGLVTRRYPNATWKEPNLDHGDWFNDGFDDVAAGTD